MTKYLQLTTRGSAVAEAIRDGQPFVTSGALVGHPRAASSHPPYLNPAEREQWLADYQSVDYVVYSYSTPIAWHTPEGGWHFVDQKFSMTTSHHQGRLYLAKREAS